MPNLNLNVSLGEHDLDWFVVMSRLANRTPDENADSVIAYYVRRNKDAYKEILQHTAKKYGLTPDECFEKLQKGESLD